MQEAEEEFGGLVVAGGDASELLEPIEHALDAVTILVSQEVACNGLGAIGPGRDDRQDAVKEQVFAHGVAVIAIVGQQHARGGGRQRHQVFDRLIIQDFAAGQLEANRASLTVCASVDFARKAAAASTKAFLMSPPFAPAAWLCPRTMVLSIMCCQSSARPRSTNVSSKASHTLCSAQRRNRT